MRRHPTLREKLAAILVLHYGIPRDIAKTMGVKRILALVQWDHYPVPWALGRDLGWNAGQVHHPTNLQPLFPEEHRIKSAKLDVPALAKTKRIAREFRRSRASCESPQTDDQSATSDRRSEARQPRPTRKVWGTRSFPKGRKLGRAVDRRKR